MDLQSSWTVATKDFSIFRRKKNILISTILFPLLISILFTLVVQFAGAKSGGISAAVLPSLLNSFSFFFVVCAATLPTAIASYSLVGEKVERSLEPLLATPITDGEILLGKSLSAFIPSMAATYAGAIVFMALIDFDTGTHSTLGYLYFPNWSMGVILLVIAPLVAILSVEWTVILSSRVNDVRTAQQLGALIAIPIGGIYVSGEIGLLLLDTKNLLIISAVLLLIDALLFYISTATFRREEILTKWNG